jgi:hypothetical protein
VTNLVPFPLKRSKPVQSGLNCVAEPMDVRGHASNSKLNFTCVHCGSQHKMQLDNVIFKSIDLFCGKCGNGWRISNPMFAANKPQAGSN